MTAFMMTYKVSAIPADHYDDYHDDQKEHDHIKIIAKLKIIFLKIDMYG